MSIRQHQILRIDAATSAKNTTESQSKTAESQFQQTKLYHYITHNRSGVGVLLWWMKL